MRVPGEAAQAAGMAPGGNERQWQRAHTPRGMC